jgi:hypothetical protein
VIGELVECAAYSLSHTIDLNAKRCSNVRCGATYLLGISGNSSVLGIRVSSYRVCEHEFAYVVSPVAIGWAYTVKQLGRK